VGQRMAAGRLHHVGRWRLTSGGGTEGVGRWGGGWRWAGRTTSGSGASRWSVGGAGGLRRMENDDDVEGDDGVEGGSGGVWN
jgi:hypothetical protein